MNNKFKSLLLIILTTSLASCGGDASIEAGLSGNTFKKYMGIESDITLPSKNGDTTLTKIGYRAFQGSYARNVIVPETYTSMSSSAFEGGHNLHSVIFKGEIGLQGHEFFDCPNLEVVRFEKPYKRSDDSSTRFAFMGCDNLKEVCLYYGLSSIEEYFIGNLNNELTLTIPSSVKTIEANAFANVSNLILYFEDYEAITFEDEWNKDSDIVIKDGGFYQNFHYQRENYNIILDDYYGDLDNVVIEPFVYPYGRVKVIDIPCLNQVDTIFFKGSFEDWMKVRFENSLGKTIGIYSETEPKDSEYPYWHYENNVPVFWEV